jgi:hypothetical protein
MDAKKKHKRGRPGIPGYRRGRALSVYVKPDTEAMIRARAKDQDKSLSAVVADAVEATEARP